MIDNDTIYVHKEIQNMLHAEDICAEASLSRRKQSRYNYFGFILITSTLQANKTNQNVPLKICENRYYKLLNV